MYAESNGNELKLYGTIWGGDGTYISREVEKFMSAQKGDVIVRLHTPGGSVFDGNMIYNTLAKSKNSIHIIIDGLCASMGTILMLASKKLSIAENAFIMIHAPSGSGYGDQKAFAELAKLLGNIEKNFISKYKTKTGLDEEKIKSWLVGDNWFSAEEALEAKLVDGIVDPVIAEDKLDFEAYMNGDYNIASMSEAFKAFDKPTTTEETPESKKEKSNKNKDMKIELLSAAALALLGFEAGAKPDAESVNAKITSMHQELEGLKAKAKADKEARVKSILDKAVEKGQILAKERSEFEEMAEKNGPEMLEKWIGKLPEKKAIGKTLNPEDNKRYADGIPEGREEWTFSDWVKKDAKGLNALKESDPEAYKSIPRTK